MHGKHPIFATSLHRHSAKKICFRVIAVFTFLLVSNIAFSDASGNFTNQSSMRQQSIQGSCNWQKYDVKIPQPDSDGRIFYLYQAGNQSLLCNIANNSNTCTQGDIVFNGTSLSECKGDAGWGGVDLNVQGNIPECETLRSGYTQQNVVVNGKSMTIQYQTKSQSAAIDPSSLKICRSKPTPGTSSAETASENTGNACQEGQRQGNTRFTYCNTTDYCKKALKNKTLLLPKIKDTQCYKENGKSCGVCTATACADEYTVKTVNGRSYGFCIPVAQQNCIDAVGDKKWNDKTKQCDCGTDKKWNTDTKQCEATAPATNRSSVDSLCVKFVPENSNSVAERGQFLCGTQTSGDGYIEFKNYYNKDVDYQFCGSYLVDNLEGYKRKNLSCEIKIKGYKTLQVSINDLIKHKDGITLCLGDGIQTIGDTCGAKEERPETTSNPEKTCTDSGGTYEDGACKCDSETKHLKSTTDNTKCECDDPEKYEFNSTDKICQEKSNGAGGGTSTGGETPTTTPTTSTSTKEDTAKKLADAKDKLAAARDTEQSFANRALGAASTAATGLGAMQLAEGIAEQNADKEAEEDMRAYIATMKCEYGHGQQVKMGDEDVTLPGGNDLLNLYTEYRQTAERLKATKKALGLRAGIESEVLYDKAQTGLYQHANTGKTGGGYTSLYNALTDETGADAAAWASQKEISAKKKTAGGIAAAGGVALGIGGNLLINGTDNITDEVDAVKSKVSGNQNNRRNRNTSSTSTTDEYGPGETTVVPANKQVAGTFQTPLTDLFKSANSTSLDAPNRESNLTSIVNKVNKWLAEDQTGALTQCITIAAKPLALAKILRDVYRNKITKEDTYIEYYVTDYIDDCQEQTCPNIYTSVHNRACGNPINEVTQGGTCAKAIEKMQNTLCTNESKYWEWPHEINNDCKKQLSNACRALVNAHCEVAIKTANPETPARILNKNQAPFNCTVTH